MTGKVEAKELVDCVKEELDADIVIGEADSSLTFEKLFGFTTEKPVTVNMSLLSMETINRISTSTRRKNVEIIHK